MHTFSTRWSSAASRAAEASASSASSSTIGQTTTPIAASASSSGWNCARKRALDAVAGLVVGPEVVAERLDHVVGGDAEVGGAALDHLEHGVQHAGHGAERLVLALVEAALPVEVAEQLVGAVDDVDQHYFLRTLIETPAEVVVAPPLSVARARRV